MSAGIDLLDVLKHQKCAIKKVRKKPLVRGEPWYIVSTAWLNLWKVYVGYDDAVSGSISRLGNSNLFPDKINNSTILLDSAKNGSDELKPSLLIGIDFICLPEEGWRLLSNYYGCLQLPIIRHVVHSGKYFKSLCIEIYLAKISVGQKCKKERYPLVISLDTSIVEVKKAVCELLSLPKEETYRLWIAPFDSTSDDGHHLVPSDVCTLREAYDDPSSALLIEVFHQDLCTEVERSLHSIDFDLPLVSHGTVCSVPNLGSSGYLSSVVLCLSRMSCFTDDLFSRYKFCKGSIYWTTSCLLRQILSGSMTCANPRSLKLCLEASPQWSEFNMDHQQDFAEFLTLLLSSLDDELRTPSLASCNTSEASGKNINSEDQKLANLAWVGHTQLKSSPISDCFYGIFKTIVECGNCQHGISIMEPFSILSLPLPERKTRSFVITVVFSDPERLHTKVEISLSKNGLVLDMLRSVAHILELGETTLLLTEIVNYKLHKVFKSNEVYKTLCSDGRDLVVFELDHSLPVHRCVCSISPCSCVGSSHSLIKAYFLSRHMSRAPFSLPVIFSLPSSEITYHDILCSLTWRVRCWLSRKSDSNSASLNASGHSHSIESDNPPFNLFLTDSKLQSGLRCFPFHGPISLSKDDCVAVVWNLPEEECSKLNFSDADVHPSVHVGATATCSNNNLHLSECLDLFTGPQLLPGRKCPECHLDKNSIGRIEFWYVPSVLVIQLKRFVWDYRYHGKNDEFVEFPLRFNMGKWMTGSHADGLDYELMAVSNHAGAIGGGHYSTLLIDPCNLHWHYIDDNEVSPLSTPTDVVSKFAYCLLYQRKLSDVSAKIDFASPSLF